MVHIIMLLFKILKFVTPLVSHRIKLPEKYFLKIVINHPKIISSFIKIIHGVYKLESQINIFDNSNVINHQFHENYCYRYYYYVLIHSRHYNK